MPKTLVPIRVRIGLRADGTADYPDFNSLPSVQASGLDWSKYVDIHGAGWAYDKTSGHQEESTGPGFRDSPVGTQWGCLLVPPVFATEAVAAFGLTAYGIQQLTEAQFETFHDQHAMAHLPEEEIDQDVLAGIKAKREAGIALSTADQEALDPTHRRRGIRQNRRKQWALRKQDDGIQMP